MSIDPKKFSPNQAWLLFQLNDAPVQTDADGDFNVLAIMDVATGLILGMEFFGVSGEEPSEFGSRKLLASAKSEAGEKPQQFFVDSEKKMPQLVRVADAMGIAVVPEPVSHLNALTEEARVGFAAHVSGARRQ